MFWLLRLGAYVLGAVAVWQLIGNESVFSGLSPAHKYLMLDPNRAMVFGVCSGISNYTGIDVTVVRLLWAILVIYWRIGIVFYILAFMIMPSS